MSTSPERPRWLVKRLPVQSSTTVRACLDDLQLGTVCQSARCPNQGECYQKQQATFLLMGPHCTRHCRFCAVTRHAPAPLAQDEPTRVAEAVKRLQLRHAVITSVTRDDLPDGGAAHFAATVRAIRATCPGVSIEILTPDFAGNREAWACVADARPDVFNHNIETVPRLYETIRPEADYRQSLDLLAAIKQRNPEQQTKSGLMVGLGETYDELLAVGHDLRAAQVDIITVGQYLCPENGKNHPVVRYRTPEEFARLETDFKGMGFGAVACGPFVRSSYQAEEVLHAARHQKTGETP